MTKFLLIIAIIFMLGWLFLVTRESNYGDTRFASWSQKCIDDGGNVSFMRSKGATRHYECTRNGEIINHVED
jgi:hypothetical protein